MLYILEITGTEKIECLLADCYFVNQANIGGMGKNKPPKIRKLNVNFLALSYGTLEAV